MNFDRQNIVTNLHRPTIEGEKRHRAPNLPFSTWRVFLRTYLSKCYEEYYRAVEELLVVEEERCVTVTGTPGIGKSIFYAYFFDKFWWVHRVEWIVIAASHERDNHLNGLAFFDNDGGTMTYPWSDDKTLSNVLNALTTRLAKQRKEDEGKRDVDKQKKVFFLCDEPPPARREQMVVDPRKAEKSPPSSDVDVMVLTRAQQAAREAAGVFDEDMENTESVEPEDVAETSETAMVAHVEEAPSGCDQ
ncbi:hypothetical protein PC119_g2071 [Phytophthora cactorum]|nr:hypothetical protein PC119_g2071 [Phytophthora cactorum]